MKVHLANSNAWSDGNEYIMGNASEVHTNALFDIYPNDTTITAEFKGNTVQSGTPSPSAPVPVVGVGYLDGTAYKIPVEIGLSTQSIDLSDVTTYRKIKKRILNGTETYISSSSWAKDNTRVFYISNTDGFNPNTTDIFILSDHFDGKSRDFLYENDINCVAMTGTASITFRIDKSIAQTSAEFKSWVAAQYAADTPVIIWYVLAEPVTDVVNEPLQKIGDYADSISNITLTTTAGATSFGVDTAVKPSEITLNFKGWHPKDPKESSGGEWS